MKISILSYNIEGLTLEYNYCLDQSLKEYIINKSKYLIKFLKDEDADIICIQEYTPVFNIEIEDYYCVKQKPHAIFYKKSLFKYVEHTASEIYGLLVTLNIDGFLFKIGTNRLPPTPENISLREQIMDTVDKMGKEETFIYAVDTNMKKAEEKVLNNIVDCFYLASVTTGYTTIDKKTNPYFSGDNNSITRTRYDKIYCSKIFDCEQFVVIKPKTNKELVHKIYPYGGLSDHYPVLAVLTI